MTQVLIEEASYENVDSIVENIFKVFSLNFSGKTVLVKPNMLGPFEPEKAVTTHPDLVRAVVRKLLKDGAKVTVGDNCGLRGYGATLRSARVSGIFEASLGCYENLAEDVVEVRLNSKFLDKVVISKKVLDVDVFISLPKFKTHALTLLSGAVKNSYGILPGAEKARLHTVGYTVNKFSQLLLDVYLIRPPDFIIMDAIYGMEGNGPTSGTIREIGKIIASDDAIAVDVAMAIMAGQNPLKIPFLKEASNRGLLKDFSKVKMLGKHESISDFKMPSTLRKSRGLWALLNKFSWLVLAIPGVIKKKCIKCGICAEHCPVGAIALDNFPVVDPEKCISCYCCQELCPEGVLDVRSFLQKITRRG